LAIAAQPITHGSHAIPVTVSIGGVTASAPLLDADSMIAAADRALYRAKSLGRNRTEFAALETP
jgi:diguanylate cyclase (GGDEF)-like protein